VSVLPGAEPFLYEPSGGESAAGTAPVGRPPAGVVLCHGFTGSPQSLRPWGEFLRDAGFTAACPRLPGHGTRWQDMNRTRWEDWYGELERTFDEMLGRMGGEPVFAMGLSMGGTLVTRLAEERGEDLAGLVLVNPSFTTLRREAKLVPALSRVVPSVPGVANDIKKPGSTELAYTRTPLKAFYSLHKLWRLARADLGKVTVPIRVYRSAEDHIVEPINTRILLDGVSSTDVEEYVLTDSYHVATLDNDAEQIFAGSVEFVNALLPRPLDPDRPR
jgi:carboxylesterase